MNEQPLFSQKIKSYNRTLCLICVPLLILLEIWALISLSVKIENTAVRVVMQFIIFPWTVISIAAPWPLVFSYYVTANYYNDRVTLKTPLRRMTFGFGQIYGYTIKEQTKYREVFRNESDSAKRLDYPFNKERKYINGWKLKIRSQDKSITLRTPSNEYHPDFDGTPMHRLKEALAQKNIFPDLDKRIEKYQSYILKHGAEREITVGIKKRRLSLKKFILAFIILFLISGTITTLIIIAKPPSFREDIFAILVVTVLLLFLFIIPVSLEDYSAPVILTFLFDSLEIDYGKKKREVRYEDIDVAFRYHVGYNIYNVSEAPSPSFMRIMLNDSRYIQLSMKEHDIEWSINYNAAIREINYRADLKKQEMLALSQF